MCSSDLTVQQHQCDPREFQQTCKSSYENHNELHSESANFTILVTLMIVASNAFRLLTVAQVAPSSPQPLHDRLSLDLRLSCIGSRDSCNADVATSGYRYRTIPEGGSSMAGVLAVQDYTVS